MCAISEHRCFQEETNNTDPKDRFLYFNFPEEAAAAVGNGVAAAAAPVPAHAEAEDGKLGRLQMVLDRNQTTLGRVGAVQRLAYCRSVKQRRLELLL